MYKKSARSYGRPFRFLGFILFLCLFVLMPQAYGIQLNLKPNLPIGKLQSVQKPLTTLKTFVRLENIPAIWKDASIYSLGYLYFYDDEQEVVGVAAGDKNSGKLSGKEAYVGPVNTPLTRIAQKATGSYLGLSIIILKENEQCLIVGSGLTRSGNAPATNNLVDQFRGIEGIAFPCTGSDLHAGF